MPTRTVNIGGKSWRVFPSGRVTQNDRDEFALLFVTGADADKFLAYVKKQLESYPEGA